MLDKLPELHNHTNSPHQTASNTYNTSQSQVSNNSINIQKNLNDLFHEHKLNIPKLGSDISGFEKTQAYMMPSNLTPLVTNAPNVNTAKPSSNYVVQSSSEMDKSIRELDEKKKLSNIDLSTLSKEESHRLFKVNKTTFLNIKQLKLKFSLGYATQSWCYLNMEMGRLPTYPQKRRNVESN